ncbi:MAG: helicase-associated domain-containing protein [Candidatus Sumerlaeota bacterium]|nr:helicase-associated domain-containing protein [Candidatus Sumerlaeota bacterium]
MKLKSILKTLPLDKLEAIHRFWGFNDPKNYADATTEAARATALTDFLYPRLQLRHSFLHAFANLEKDEKDLVYFLAIHGGDLEPSEVIERCYRGEAGKFHALVERLATRGFVFLDTFKLGREAVEMVGLPEPYLRYVELPSYWEGYLGSFLKSLPTPRLKTIANKGLKLGLKTSKKHLLIWRIRRALTDPRFLRDAVQRLPAEQRDILETLLEKRGVSVYRDLLDQSYSLRYDHARADHIQALSTVSGLVYVAVEGENKQNNLLMAPRDLAFIIRGGYHPDRRSLRELDTVSMPSDEAQGLVLDNSGHLLRDLAVFVAAIRNHPPRVLTGGGIGRNDLKRILPSLSSRKTLKHVRFLALFCIRRKFLLPSGGLWTASEAFEKWLGDAYGAYRDFYTFWLDSTSWNEEYPDGDVAHAEPPPSNLIHAGELRRMTLRNLESIPHDDWIDFGAFAEGLTPQIEMGIPGRNPSGETPMLRHNVLAAESVVAESLYWLGVVMLGVPNASKLEELGSRGDETLDPLVRHGVGTAGKRSTEYSFAFKPTAMGREILRGQASDPAKLFSGRGSSNLRIAMEARQFTVQPNLEILAPPDLHLPLLYRLCQFCEVISVDVMSTLSVTRRSVREAMDRGLHGEALISFLETHSNIPLPDTVRHLVHECAAKHGEVDIGYSGGYIYVSDRALLEEIRSHRRIRDSVKDVLGENVIALTPQADITRLARELRKAGFMPRVDSETVHVTKDGDYFVRLSPEELYDLQGILKFVGAMEDELGRTVTEDKARPLLERLQPNPANRFNLADFADTICKSFLRRYHAARKKQIDEVAGRYKKQLARLLTAGSSVEPRPAFDGPNPAAQAEDVRRLLEYAIKTECRVEIAYRHPKDGAVRDTIEPESLSEDRVYGYSDDRDDRSAYLLSRIRHARLL